LKKQHWRFTDTYYTALSRKISTAFVWNWTDLEETPCSDVYYCDVIGHLIAQHGSMIAGQTSMEIYGQTN